MGLDCEPATVSYVVMLECPNCGYRFPVVPVDSRGWCKCGMDYDLDTKAMPLSEATAVTLTWTPDPQYTPDAEPHVVSLVAETWPE